MQEGIHSALRVPRIFHTLVRLRRAHAWSLVVICTAVLALGDILASDGLWFGPAYLLVICLAAWSLGWQAGQATGIGCMALTFAINGASLYPYNATELAANVAMRFVAVSLVIVIVAGMRQAYIREWWLARTDLLTGVLNRQAFFELAATALDPLSWRLLLYADLDGLKRVNDLQGHAAGDASLKAYAVAIRAIIRRDDIFARVGGDEFLVFMPILNEQVAKTVACRLHAAMNAIVANNAPLGCSVGALVVSPGTIELDSLVRQADQLMYRAKQHGSGLEFGSAIEYSRDITVARARRLRRLPPASPSPATARLPDRRAPAGRFVPLVP